MFFTVIHLHKMIIILVCILKTTLLLVCMYYAVALEFRAIIH